MRGSNMGFFTKRRVVAIVAVILAIIAMGIFVDIVNIHGNEVGVVEHWYGLRQDPIQPGLHFILLGKAYKYQMDSRVYVMNDKPGGLEKAEGREKDSYKVQSSEGQDMIIESNVRWRLDPTRIVDIHRNLRDNLEEKILRPELLGIIKNQATTRTAIEAYSGAGLVKLQQDIYMKLSDPEGHLAKRGILVENFVIEHIGLNEKYIGEITERQIAVQTQLKAAEKTKAAEAMALTAKAEAQADLNKRVVEAERDKQVGVLKADQEAQMLVLKAEAEKKQIELQADAQKIQMSKKGEGEQAMMTARAEGERALGMAQAQVEEAKKKAMYEGEAGVRRAQVEVANALATKLNGMLTGVRVIPEKAFVALVQEGGQIPITLTDSALTTTQPSDK